MFPSIKKQHLRGTQERSRYKLHLKTLPTRKSIKCVLQLLILYSKHCQYFNIAVEI
jgi:hypothetical protein